MKGFVAFLDILGFSNLILSGDFTDKFEQYTEIIKKELITEGDDLSYITFSDSLIINTEKDDQDQLLLLASSISKISYDLLIEMGIPICGCISVGDFSRIETDGNVMIAGSPIIEAYEYEKLQDWIGVMLHPRIIKQFPLLQPLTYISSYVMHKNALAGFRWSSTLRRYPNIPLGGSNYDGFSIIPRKSTSKKVSQWLNDLVNYNMKLDQLKLSAPDHHTQRKYSRAGDFITSVYGQWVAYTEDARWIQYVESLGDIDHFTYARAPETFS